jgi:putative ABC transport system substrate-binding protein
MRRSTAGFLITLALCLAPLALEAQPSGQVRLIGFLTAGPRSLIAPSSRFEAFQEGLRILGWVEGQNLTIEMRYAEGRPERLPALAAELVTRNVECIVVAGGTAVLRAVQHATRTIPIVGVSMADPVEEGFVASFAQPGGNITGVGRSSLELTGKRLELLKEAVPGVQRMAVLANPAAPRTLLHVHAAQGAAQALGVELHVVEVRRAEEFESAFAAIMKAGAGALFVLADPYLFERHVSAIVALELQSRLPAMYPWKMYPDAGGLLSYEPSLVDSYRRAATYVDKILNGAKPGDLPVEQPTKFELVINLKTAKALGITMPPSLLVLANEVIQ